MFPRSRARKQVATEADEERMASRLQLDLGLFLLHNFYAIVADYFAERDSLARKSAKSGEKVVGVNVFRGISFDDWLRIFMQVS